MTEGSLIAVCRVVRGGALAFLLTASLACTHAESLQPDTSRPTKIGVFLNSVFDINPGRDSYVADPLCLVFVTGDRARSWLEELQEVGGQAARAASVTVSVRSRLPTE